MTISDEHRKALNELLADQEEKLSQRIEMSENWTQIAEKPTANETSRIHCRQNGINHAAKAHKLHERVEALKAILA